MRSLSREPLAQTNPHHGADWTGVFNGLKNAVKLRHYSPKTLKTYSGWARKFQTYTKSKDPSLMAS